MSADGSDAPRREHMTGMEQGQTGARDDGLDGRRIRIAAVGDLHFDGMTAGALREIFADANHQADVLALLGDMTTHGRPEQVATFISELKGVEIPMVAVLGNHDYEEGHAPEICALLQKRGVHVLDGDSVVIDGVGFAGTKGFAGGFGRGALAPFGEPIIKEFAKHAIDEAIKLENALRTLPTETRVVLLHYSPIEETVHGEPEVIWAFLGSSRLVQPIDTIGATVVFHGHAHHGAREGRTPAGVPVYNAALPLLRESGLNFVLHEINAPERRGQGERSGRRATEQAGSR